VDDTTLIRPLPLRARPEARIDRMTVQVLLASVFGSSWSSALRRVIGPPDPCASALPPFNSFSDS
jgi:hypothetical protein